MTFVSCNDRKLLAFCSVDKNKSEIKYTAQQLHIATTTAAQVAAAAVETTTKFK